MEFKNFPRPTRPLSFSKLTSFKYSAAILQPSEPVILEECVPPTSISSGPPPEGEVEEVFDELTQILLECLEQVDKEHRGLLLWKMFSELETNSQMENLIVEKLKHSRAKVISKFLERYPESLRADCDQQGTLNRGFDDDLMEVHGASRSIAEFTHKLERFKVKSVNLGGAVIKKEA